MMREMLPFLAELFLLVVAGVAFYWLVAYAVLFLGT